MCVLVLKPELFKWKKKTHLLNLSLVGILPLYGPCPQVSMGISPEYPGVVRVLID